MNTFSTEQLTQYHQDGSDAFLNPDDDHSAKSLEP